MCEETPRFAKLEREIDFFAPSCGVCKSNDPSGFNVAVVLRSVASRPWWSSVKKNFLLAFRVSVKELGGEA